MNNEPQVLPKPPKTTPTKKPIKPVRKTPFNPGPKIDPNPKALLMFFLVILFMVGCNDNQVVISKDEYNKLKNIPQPEYPKPIKVHNVSGNFFDENQSTTLYVLLIDSCEYIFMERSGDGGPALTHKGNCKFCKQTNQK